MHLLVLHVLFDKIFQRYSRVTNQLPKNNDNRHLLSVTVLKPKIIYLSFYHQICLAQQFKHLCISSSLFRNAYIDIQHSFFPFQRGILFWNCNTQKMCFALKSHQNPVNTRLKNTNIVIPAYSNLWFVPDFLLVMFHNLQVKDNSYLSYGDIVRFTCIPCFGDNK